MCRIKFQVESLQTFSLWKVVQYVKHADLGVIGPVGQLRSVTVKTDQLDIDIEKDYTFSFLIGNFATEISA